MAVTEHVETSCREEGGSVGFAERFRKRDLFSLTREVINSDEGAVGKRKDQRDNVNRESQLKPSLTQESSMKRGGAEEGGRRGEVSSNLLLWEVS